MTGAASAGAERGGSRPAPHPHPARALFVAVRSLALGGAERIVLDFAIRRAAVTGAPVELLVLERALVEWPVPRGVALWRADGPDRAETIARFGVRAAAAGAVVVAHLWRRDERAHLQAAGVDVVAVVHNSRAGWLEPASALSDARAVLTVSESSARELREEGCARPLAVIRHFPACGETTDERRRMLRASWSIPDSALVLGMIGAIKPQKAYPQAIRILREVRRERDAYLVIVGGPIGRHGARAQSALLAQIDRLGISHAVRLLGFVQPADALIAGFDVFLNTSLYEGLSIATLEALAHRLPAVVSDVGGQGEVAAPGLTLVTAGDPPERWARAVLERAADRPAMPPWRGFPSHRLWALAALAARPRSGRRVSFVTANLNLGGAQRSLVNLACGWSGRREIEVTVAGPSSWSAFSERIERAGVRIERASASRDVFDQAESIVASWAERDVGTLVFWNLDPKLKLVLAHAAAVAALPVYDVSPGDYAREEISAVAAFGAMLGLPPARYYAGLHALVHKYSTQWEEATAARTAQPVIPNGVDPPRRIKREYRLLGPARIVVAGRIAPSKFLEIIIAGVRIVRQHGTACELHVLGSADARHREYEQACFADAPPWIVRHPAVAEVGERLAGFDLFVVLGEHQGCPNALLEAMSAGLPCIANDSGGTRELIRHRRTGWLLDAGTPAALAGAIEALLTDRRFAERLARNGRAHVARRFSMRKMTDAYARLLDRPPTESQP